MEYKLDTELKQITNISFANGYPVSVVLSNIKIKISDIDPPKCSVYIKRRWIGPRSLFFFLPIRFHRV